MGGTVTLRHLIAAPAAIAILLATALPVSAECWPGPPGPRDVVPVKFAFVATVEQVRDPVNPAVDVANYRWFLELSVDRVYRGDVPRSLKLSGFDAGCSFIAPVGLQAGDVLFIAIDRLDPGSNRSLEGQLLMWRRTDDGWAFAEDALSYGTYSNFWPIAAREARSTEEILAVIRSGKVPDTATAPHRPTDASFPHLPFLGLTFLVTTLVGAMRGFRATGDGRTTS
jgi:hypothetical protein